MSIKELEQALSIIDDNPEDSFFVGVRGDDLILEAESILELKFPPTYKRFLKTLGAGNIAGQEFYGVINNDLIDSTVPDGVWFTLSTREEYGLPDDMIVIGSIDDGTYIVLNAHKDNSELEADVLEWHPETEEEYLIADDFGTYLLEKITTSLELNN